MFHGIFAPHLLFRRTACHRWHHGVAASGHHAVGVGGRGGGAPGEAGESRGGAAEEQVGGASSGWGLGPLTQLEDPSWWLIPRIVSGL